MKVELPEPENVSPVEVVGAEKTAVQQEVQPEKKEEPAPKMFRSSKDDSECIRGNYEPHIRTMRRAISADNLFTLAHREGEEHRFMTRDDRKIVCLRCAVSKALSTVDVEKDIRQRGKYLLCAGVLDYVGATTNNNYAAITATVVRKVLMKIQEPGTKLHDLMNQELQAAIAALATEVACETSPAERMTLLSIGITTLVARALSGCKCDPRETIQITRPKPRSHRAGRRVKEQRERAKRNSAENKERPTISGGKASPQTARPSRPVKQQQSQKPKQVQTAKKERKVQPKSAQKQAAKVVKKQPSSTQGETKFKTLSERFAAMRPPSEPQ